MPALTASNPSIIADLQESCQMFASLAGQYQVDVVHLHAAGLGWLQKRVKKWYMGSEDFLRKFIKRLDKFGVSAIYQADVTVEFTDASAMLNRQYKAVSAAHEMMVKYRENAWKVEADYTPDIYEHAIEELESQICAIYREQTLVKQLGLPGYIGARLEDE
jgi:hypothetical protein